MTDGEWPTPTINFPMFKIPSLTTVRDAKVAGWLFWNWWTVILIKSLSVTKQPKMPYKQNPNVTPNGDSLAQIRLLHPTQSFIRAQASDNRSNGRGGKEGRWCMGGLWGETVMKGAGCRRRKPDNGMVRLSGGCLEVMVVDRGMGVEKADDQWLIGEKSEYRLILHSRGGYVLKALNSSTASVNRQLSPGGNYV